MRKTWTQAAGGSHHSMAGLVNVVSLLLMYSSENCSQRYKMHFSSRGFLPSLLEHFTVWILLCFRKSHHSKPQFIGISLHKLSANFNGILEGGRKAHLISKEINVLCMIRHLTKTCISYKISRNVPYTQSWVIRERSYINCWTNCFRQDRLCFLSSSITWECMLHCWQAFICSHYLDWWNMDEVTKHKDGLQESNHIGVCL